MIWTVVCRWLLLIVDDCRGAEWILADVETGCLH
jgi:hypothetical protein